MEPRFVNHTVLDKSILKDFMQLTWEKTAGMLRAGMILLSLFSILYPIYRLWRDGTSALSLAIMMWIVGLVSLFMAFRGYLLRINGFVRAQQQRWNSETLDMEYRFYEDHIEQESKFGSHNINYDLLDYVKEKNTTAVLMMGDEALLVNMSGFTEGSVDAFKQFIVQEIEKNAAVREKEMKAQQEAQAKNGPPPRRGLFGVARGGRSAPPPPSNDVEELVADGEIVDMNELNGVDTEEYGQEHTDNAAAGFGVDKTDAEDNEEGGPEGEAEDGGAAENK